MKRRRSYARAVAYGGVSTQAQRRAMEADDDAYYAKKAADRAAAAANEPAPAEEQHEPQGEQKHD